MNMKNTVILLMLLLSILGLIIGIYYSEDIGSENSHESDFERIHEENGSVLTITLNETEKDYLTQFFT